MYGWMGGWVDGWKKHRAQLVPFRCNHPYVVILHLSKYQSRGIFVLEGNSSNNRKRTDESYLT